MTGGTVGDGAFAVLCPHCGKRFTAQLLTGRPTHPRGFKCPHCRLFVPAERAERARPG